MTTKNTGSALEAIKAANETPQHLYAMELKYSQTKQHKDNLMPNRQYNVVGRSITQYGGS